MNTELISTITVCIIIAVLAADICKIFINCMIFIAKSIANEPDTINLKSDLIVVMTCTLIICIHFLI